MGKKNLSEKENGICRILIVEDDADIGAFLVQVLKDETPYQSLLVNDAATALKTIKTLRPHLFILDYQLPGGIDGLELYSHLRETEGLEQTPTLFMSANLPLEKIKRYSFHVRKKPFELDEFLRCVTQLLE